MTIMRCLWQGKSIEIAILMTMLYEPRHEKKQRSGFGPGPTQIRL